jgi:twinkle protein
MGNFLYHEACNKCGSSDAKAVYDNGTAYCFSCKYNFSSEDGTQAEPLETHAPKKKFSGDFLEGSHRPLNKRHINLSTCQFFDYRVAKTMGTGVQVANYYDAHRNLVAQHLRFPDKQFQWLGDAKQVVLFGQHLYPSGGKRLVITEGEIDAMSVAAAFNHKIVAAVSVPSGAASAKKYIRQQLEYIESFQEVIFAFDDDEPGRVAVEECAMFIQPGKAKTVSYKGLKDANDLFKQDPDALRKAIYGAEVWRPDGIIGGESLWDLMLKEPEAGLETPYPLLNAKFLGLRKGELYLFTAGSGIGKSTIVREIGYHFLKKHNQTLGVIALEESPKVTADSYVSLELNAPLKTRRKEFDLDQIKEAYKETVGSGRFYLYNHFGSTQIEALLSKIRYMAVGLGVDWLVLDHISIVVSGLDEIMDDERRLIDRLMTKLRSLIEETGIGVLAIVHLKRPPGQGKSYNEGRVPTLTDLRGSGALEQLSDGVIAQARDQMSEEYQNFGQLYVLKNRYLGYTGKADLLEWNDETGRLLPNDTIEFPNERGGYNGRKATTDDF